MIETVNARLPVASSFRQDAHLEQATDPKLNKSQTLCKGKGKGEEKGSGRKSTSLDQFWAPEPGAAQPKLEKAAAGQP